MHTPRGATRAYPVAVRAIANAPRSHHLTLQRITLVLAVPGLDFPVTACPVSGARYILCFPRTGMRPRFVTVPRATLALVLRHGVRIVGRI